MVRCDVSTRGIALAATLLLMSVLMILTTSLLKTLGGQNFGAQAHYRQALAQQAAEAALSHALARLRSQSNWSGGIPWQSLSQGEASYRVEFGSAASVNNLLGPAALDGPRGPATVPPHSVWLVCEGRSGTARRTLEALIGSERIRLDDTALLSRGRIRAWGKFSIDGLTEPGGDASQAGVHSNLETDSGAPSFHWSPLQPTDTATVTGGVTARDGRPPEEALRFDGVHSVGSLRSREGPRRSVQFDIPGLVSQARTTALPLTLQADETVVPPGKYYLEGPISNPGSLTLQAGAEVYVHGDLELSGAVRGKGSVIVDGATHLRGDVELAAGNKVALLSQGDVHLEGYDASGYLDGITGAPGVVSNINSAMDRIISLCQSGDLGVMGSNGRLDQANHVLNTGSGNSYNNLPQNQLVVLRDMVSGQPADPRRDFLVKRLDSLIPYHDHGGGSQDDRVDWVRSFLAQPSTRTPKVLEALSDDYGNLQTDLTEAERRQALKLVAQIARTVRADGLSTSYFEGLIYTEGRFQADKGVSIVGGLVSGQDVELNQGIRLTYLKSLFDSQDPIEIPGALQVKTWILR